MRFLSRALVSAAVLTALTTSASAALMDFSGMGNFASYAQSGINMSSTDVWNWPGADMAHMDGGTAVFTLASGFDFNLDSVEMIASGGNGPARFSAFNNGSLLGSVDIAGNAGVFNFGALFSGIDEFRVTVPGSHFTFDNINISEASVPEPGSVALVGLALLAGVGVKRGRRSLATRTR